MGKIFDIQPGDHLIVLGDEAQGIALIKEEGILEMMGAIRNAGFANQEEDNDEEDIFG